MKQYDVFISYRRSSHESANLIATRLRAAGYRVFFDLETMRSGPFNEQLFNIIESCDDFVLVLPPNALDRCHDEDDWVRKEVLHAMEHRKNIIPILLRGFQWPKTMPAGMEKLCMYQGVATSIDYFDLAMERLESYLKSRKYTRQRVLARWICMIIMGLIVLSSALLLLCRLLAKPVCEEVVENLTLKIGVVDLLIADNNMLAEAWTKYSTQSQEDVELYVEIAKKNLSEYDMGVANPINLSSWQKFLLSIYGTSATQLANIDEYVSSLQLQLNKNIELIQNTIAQSQLRPSEYDMVRNQLLLYPCLGESLYYSYLSILNKFPESSLDGYYQLAPMLENMPKTGLGLKNSEYELLIKRSNEKGKGVIKSLADGVSNTKDAVYELEQRLDSINQAALAQYRAFVESVAIKAGESSYSNWNKILVLASTLQVAIEMQKEALAEGEDMGSITPQLVLSDINNALDDFKAYHNVVFIEAAKEFYKQLLAGKVTGGVLVYEFAANRKHEVYQIGDIIVEWNGEDIDNLEMLKQSYAKSSSGKLKLLRLCSNSLKEMEIEIPGGEDIVAFVDLVCQK